MKGKKIGDLITIDLNNVVHDFSEIEEIIFPQNIKNGGPTTWKYIFNKETIIEPRLAKRLQISEDTIIGRYEQRLLSKIIESQDPLLFIKGVVGSGKSSAMSFIREQIDNTPISIQGQVKGERAVFYLDFNGYHLQSLHDERRIINELKKTCANKIRLIVENRDYISPEEEVTGFWSYLKEKAIGNEINPLVEDFSVLLSENQQIYTNLTNISDGEELEERRQIKDIFLRNPDYCLFYYFELLVYIRQKKFNNDKSAFVFIFDNIDSAPVIVQSAFAQMIKPFRYQDSPRIIVPIRNRTLDRIHFDYYSSIPNFIDQEGPEPINVIIFYLRKFINNKEYYFDQNKTISKDEFEFLYNYLSTVLQKIDKNNTTSQRFKKFINSLCGKCIRLAIQIADGLFYIDEEINRKLVYDENEKLIEEKFNLFDIMRCMLRRGKTIVYQDNKGRSLQYYPINSMFNFDSDLNTGKDLVKLRILKFLSLKKAKFPHDIISLGDLVDELTNFGYTLTNTIRPAINDLLVVHRQLIMTNDLDGYEEQELASATKAKVSITDIGNGYLELVKSLDYFQELMMDACVDEAEFSKTYAFDRIPDKLRLIQHYLLYLFERDVTEIRNYFASNSSRNYMNFYGNYPITWDIVVAIVETMNLISYSQINDEDKDEKYKEPYKEVLIYNNQFLLPTTKSKIENLFHIRIPG